MNIAIVLSGGKGLRLGSRVPKQYIKVAEKPIIIYSLYVLDKSPFIDKIQIVAEEEWQDDILSWAKDFLCDGKISGFSLPGENRQMSIYNALTDIGGLADKPSNVFIHDAARPGLTYAIIENSFKALDGYDGVIPVLPMKDTVYKSTDGKTIGSLLERDQIYSGQAPETFAYGKYLQANESLVKSGDILKINGSTEPAIMAGMKIRMIAGDECNYKITTKDDLDRFKERIKNESAGTE